MKGFHEKISIRIWLAHALCVARRTVPPLTVRGTVASRECKLTFESTGLWPVRGSLGNYPYVDRNLTLVTGMSVFRTLAERLGLCVHARDRTRSSFGYSSLRPLKDRFPRMRH